MLNPDFREMLSACIAEEAEFLVMGAYALAAHDGVEFEEAWPNRRVAEIDGLAVPLPGLAELIRNTRATGRPQDLLDADLLERGDAGPE